MLINGINEIGIGYANQYLNDKLTIGAKIKMVQGLIHGSLDDDFEGSLHTRESDYLWTIGVRNGQVNSAA